MTLPAVVFSYTFLEASPLHCLLPALAYRMEISGAPFHASVILILVTVAGQCGTAAALATAHGAKCLPLAT